MNSSRTRLREIPYHLALPWLIGITAIAAFDRLEEGRAW